MDTIGHLFKICWRHNDGRRHTSFENGPNYRVALAKLGLNLKDCIYIKRIRDDNGNVLEEIYSNIDNL